MIEEIVQHKTEKLNCDYCGRPNAHIRESEQETLCKGCFSLDVERLIGVLIQASPCQIAAFKRSVRTAEVVPATITAALNRIA